MSECPTIDEMLARPKAEWILLGEGGQGIVYKIGDYVLKIIDLQDDMRKRQAFQFEKEILEDLDSNIHLLGFLPQLCSIEEKQLFTQYRGYILQRYEKSVTLHEYMKYFKDKNKKISFSVGSNIIRNLMKGLISLHIAKYVHRDIKPENILIRVEEKKNKSSPYVVTNTKPIFIDFGLACKLPCNDAPLAGTPEYMPSNYLPPFMRNKERNPLRLKAPTILPFTKPKKMYDYYALMLILEELINLIDFTSGTAEEIENQMKFKGSILQNIEKTKKDILFDAVRVKGKMISDKYEYNANTIRRLENLNTSVRKKMIAGSRKRRGKKRGTRKH